MSHPELLGKQTPVDVLLMNMMDIDFHFARYYRKLFLNCFLYIYAHKKSCTFELKIIVKNV